MVCDVAGVIIITYHYREHCLILTHHNMGGGNSVNHITSTEAILMLMPVYYQDGEVTPDDVALARRSWNNIVNNESQKFFRSSGTSTSAPSCLSWFYESFYKRLFDVSCKYFLHLAHTLIMCT